MAAMTACEDGNPVAFLVDKVFDDAALHQPLVLRACQGLQPLPAHGASLCSTMAALKPQFIGLQSTRLAGEKLDHSRASSMQAAFVHIAFGFLGVQEFQARQFALEIGKRHHQCGIRRAAGTCADTAAGSALERMSGDWMRKRLSCRNFSMRPAAGCMETSNRVA